MTPALRAACELLLTLTAGSEDLDAEPGPDQQLVEQAQLRAVFADGIDHGALALTQLTDIAVTLLADRIGRTRTEVARAVVNAATQLHGDTGGMTP